MHNDVNAVVFGSGVVLVVNRSALRVQDTALPKVLQIPGMHRNAGVLDRGRYPASTLARANGPGAFTVRLLVHRSISCFAC